MKANTPSILLRNPQNGRSMWFGLPMFFGQLQRIGLTGNYNETVELIDQRGEYIPFPPGSYTIADLEDINNHIEYKL